VVTLVAFATAGERAKRRQANGAAPPPIESALLMEVATGAILFEKDIHKQRAPASMVKMMLMLIVMEKLRAGELHLVIASRHGACEQNGRSQVYLREGEFYARRDDEGHRYCFSE
jgi:D-alanyl-D-alanine carboxypeptidase (penicillin-binding protein 5/6)